MEEDGGVKAAPVTRLRRRLSIEQSDLGDTKSPSAPSTPTKKRGGRLAAKPQLELIDENVPQNSPKRATRKSIARDIVEPEEKSVTPSRRSTRVKSNTSIVSETALTFDSPRAKRAARRTSQVGSDNEAPITPARTRRTRKDSTSSVDKTSPTTEPLVTPGRTRRTRKDSTSSIDKPAETAPSALITEVIVEEPENNLRQSTSNTETSADGKDLNTSPSVRKSPRLAKKGRRSYSNRSDVDSNDNDVQDSNETSQKSESSKTPKSAEHDTSKEYTEPTETKKDKLSISSANLINDLETEPKMRSSLNKSLSAIKDSDDSKRRHRTKSWSTLSGPQSNEGLFYSDNESTKRKFKKQELERLSNQAGSGDGLLNTINKSDSVREEKITEVIITSSKKKKKRSETSFTAEIETSMKELLTPNKSGNLNKSTANPADISNKENLLGVNPKNLDSSVTDLLFEKTPSMDIKAMVFIEDSDTESLGKTNKDKQLDIEDQCVPVVDHKLENEKSPKKLDQSLSKVFTVFAEEKDNDSCEPMDIDETMPENVSLTEFSKDNEQEVDGNETKGKQSRKSSLSVSQGPAERVNESINKSKRKSSLSNLVSEDLEITVNENKSSLNLSKVNESINKSKRKSSISNSISQDLEKTGNENKSTLILSQIKDVSSTENNMSKSQTSNNEHLSKSMDVPDSAKDDIVKKSVVVNYSTSTPVQQKDFKKLGMQMNTSVITPNNKSKNELRESKNLSKKDVSVISKATEKSDSSEEESDDADDEEENESSNDKSNLMDDEAEDAGDDYESGDSQDEDERQYEKENEIVENGETLTSDDEMSDDSDYEKDSFIVSSDQEDDELLSGSGDDLDMSDNELTMSAKSKKKFNERKSKEQKKASREMFEARHKLNESDKSLNSEAKTKKSNRLRLDSTLLDSDEDAKLPLKKQGRMRLDSSLTKSDTDEVKSNNKNSSVLSDPEEIGYKKKKSKRLSEYNDSVMNEKEITVREDDNTEKDDPLSIKVRQEPKTPQKPLDISTIHFTDREEVEQVEIDENASMMKPNEAMDPLQATMGQDEVTDSDSISENEEITKNYDSVLNELNKSNTSKQIKSCDISLNLNKKSKTVTEPIIEQLNLTQTKKSKKYKNAEMDKSNDKTLKSAVQNTIKDDDEASSDSIDLKLLLSEDSNGSERKDSGIGKKEKREDEDKCIPLKRTKGKTNILEDKDAGSALNTSTKKKTRKSHQSSHVEDFVTTNETEKDNVNFFVDTTGAIDLDSSMNTTLNTSSKKKKNKKNSISFVEDVQNEDENNEPSKNFFIDTTGAKDSNISMDASLNTSSKKKKNKKNSISFVEDIQNEDENKETSINFFVDTTGLKDSNISMDTTLNTSSKKKKNKKNSISLVEDVRNDEETSVNFFVDTTGARPEMDTSKNTSLNTSSMKKKNKKNSISFSVEPEFIQNAAAETNDAPTELSYRSEKNKQSNKLTEQCEDTTEQSKAKTSKSEKKKKKKQSESHDSSEDVTDGVMQNISLTSKKTTTLEIPKTENTNLEKDNQAENKELITSARKRKRKSSASISIEILSESANKALKSPEALNEPAVTESRKKKRKVSQKEEANNVQNQDAVFGISSATSMPQENNLNKNTKKNKRSKTLENKMEIASGSEVEKIVLSKKRKERDDDDTSKKTKVLKENSFDKIHVPRLPATFLHQLEDKPQKEVLDMRKAKLTSTSEFKVEQTIKRKNKPSNYLEESIHLNDAESPPEKKQKSNIKKPKVLPFIPTASTSVSGFTTKFQVNVLPKKMEFVAQRSELPNFKNDMLNNNRVKKMRTYELYRNHRTVKLSKY